MQKINLQYLSSHEMESLQITNQTKTHFLTLNLAHEIGILVISMLAHSF